MLSTEGPWKSISYLLWVVRDFVLMGLPDLEVNNCRTQVPHWHFNLKWDANSLICKKQQYRERRPETSPTVRMVV